MEIVHYLRVIKRRWRLVVVCAVVGVLVGVASTALGSQDTSQVSFYLAKHTLQTDGAGVNLDRAAALTTEGEVPRRAAEKLGVASPQALASQVKAESRPDVGFLYIAATGTDPQRSVEVADTFANELTAYLDEQDRKAAEADIAQLNARLSALETEITDLDAEVKAAEAAGNTAQADVLDLQLSDKRQEYNETLASQRALQSGPAPSQNGRLITLSTAEAIPISGKALAKLLATDTSQRDSTTVNATKASQIDQAINGGATDSKTVRAGMGGLVGLVLGITLVLLLERIDPRVRTKEEAEAAFGWPVIGEIPPLNRREQFEAKVLAYDEPRSRAAEAFRVVRSALLFAGDAHADGDDSIHPLFADAIPEPVASDDAPPADDATRPAEGQVIMVTSPGPSEGKTTTTSNLAAIWAETGRSVLVINCDFRRPKLHTYLGTEIVSRQVLTTRIPGVSIVPQVMDEPDDTNPAAIVAAQRKIIRNARRLYDVVLLDTAPLLTTNDATEVLSSADQVVVVSRAGRTNKDAADRCAELLERRQAMVTGIVLVGATDIPTSRYYYYEDTTARATDPAPGHDDGSPLDELVSIGAPTSEADATASTSSGPAVDGSSSATAGDDTGPDHPVAFNEETASSISDESGNPLDVLAASGEGRQRRRSRRGPDTPEA
jgi:Mrp family chromosome partitioning ATPase/capsular polysaccharide biosynthesis protein